MIWKKKAMPHKPGPEKDTRLKHEVIELEICWNVSLIWKKKVKQQKLDLKGLQIWQRNDSVSQMNDFSSIKLYSIVQAD